MLVRGQHCNASPLTWPSNTPRTNAMTPCASGKTSLDGPVQFSRIKPSFYGPPYFQEAKGSIEAQTVTWNRLKARGRLRDVYRFSVRRSLLDSHATQRAPKTDNEQYMSREKSSARLDHFQGRRRGKDGASLSGSQKRTTITQIRIQVHTTIHNE